MRNSFFNLFIAGIFVTVSFSWPTGTGGQEKPQQRPLETPRQTPPETPQQTPTETPRVSPEVPQQVVDTFAQNIRHLKDKDEMSDARPLTHY